MIHLTSDLRLNFEQLGIRFQAILNDHKDELDTILKKAVLDFDFENVVAQHAHNIIHEGLEKAFSEIDISEQLKIKIWAELERRMGEKE